LRATKRGRGEPLLLLAYGCVIPAIDVFGGDASEVALQTLLWGWGLLAVVACLIAAFAETNAERARRYLRWIQKYERDLDEDAKCDERDRPKRRAAYEEDLAKYRVENPRYPS
jgi:hypothetical protein